MDTTMICPHCKQSFEISDAIQHQIADALSRAKTEQSASLRKEYDAAIEAKLKQAVQSAEAKVRQAARNQIEKDRQAAELELAQVRQSALLEAEKAQQAAELAVKKAEQARELAVEKAKQATGLETERLRNEAAASKENEKQLRKQSADLLEELSKANTAREEAELAARKELLEKEKGIRAEAAQKASEDFNTKIREQEETINRLREQLTAAKQVAEQGSQQLQGEILELDIEAALRLGFPFDTVAEVKKGERGSDIRQVVNDRAYMNCGLILWECKNAKTYQAAWLAKLKDELATEKAQVGVIVFQSTDGDGDDFKQLSDNIWLVKPRYVNMLATLLREAIVRVFAANRAAEGKDVKTELMYQYFTGSEFSNRIRNILESYNEMTAQLTTEKKQAQKRWAAQEKILQKVTSGIYGMSGDLQGIMGKEIISLPATADDEEEV